MTLKLLEDGPAVEERFGAWSVFWRSDGFLLPDTGAFRFCKIVLPLEIIVCDAARGLGDLIVTLESSYRFEILLGAPIHELEKFKRRVSAEVLANAGLVRHICSDCARDAGLDTEPQNGDVCPGCREPYCRNPKCLRRLDAPAHETKVCANCGEAVGS